MRVRRVRLRVANVPWMEHYHGREAKLVGELVDAVELEQDESRGRVSVAYVDDRDGEASEYVEALENLARTPAMGTMRARVMRELQEHAARRLLHGEVEGVRT